MNLTKRIGGCGIDEYFDGVYSSQSMLESLECELVSKQNLQQQYRNEFDNGEWGSEEDFNVEIDELEIVISYLKSQISMFRYSTKIEYERLNKTLYEMIENNKKEIQKLEVK